MKRIIGLIFILVFLLNLSLAQIINPDKPAKGIWDFKMEKVFEINKAGEDIFNQIRTIKFSKNNIYVVDQKLIKIHIFNHQGKYIKSFGRSGEGPGEIQHINSTTLFAIENMVILQARGILNYYTALGDFIKKVILPAEYAPVAFLSPDEFISAPRTARGDVKNEKIKIYNIKKKKAKTVTDFQAFDKASNTQRSSGNVMTVSILIGGLTPMMNIHYSQSKIYFGMSDQFNLNVVDLNTDKKLFFGIKDKKGKPVPKNFLENLKKGMKNMPSKMVNNIIDGLPRNSSCFTRIFVDNKGFIYTLNPELDESLSAEVDIFSSEGKYLYKGFIKVPEGVDISNIRLMNDAVILSVEDEEGDISIFKYKIDLPEK